MCLSDGMGSGLEACRESENVVDMLEQFVDSGFTGETAARMVNSVLNLQTREMCIRDRHGTGSHGLLRGTR